MSLIEENAAAVQSALQSMATPADGWNAAGLRHACTLSSRNFADAVGQLRRDGKLHCDRLELTVRGQVTNVAIPETIAETVRDEAERAGASRAAARSTGTVVGKSGEVQRTVDGLSIGGQFQALALEDDHMAAANIVRTRWNDVWKRVCIYAGVSGQRPIPALIELLETGLDAEEHELGAAA